MPKAFILMWFWPPVVVTGDNSYLLKSLVKENCTHTQIFQFLYSLKSFFLQVIFYMRTISCIYLYAERHRPVEMHPEKGHNNDPRDGTPLLWGQVERAGAVKPGEEKAVMWPNSGLSVSKGELQEVGDRLFSSVCGNRMRGNGFKLKESSFRLDMRKKPFTVRVDEALEQIT